MNINKKLIYFLGVPSALLFSFFSFFYYAFSGGNQTEEFFTGILLLLISFLSVMAIFFIKNKQKIAGNIFILSGVLALIVISVFIGNPIFLFTRSVVGVILISTPIILITTGIITISLSK